MLAHMHWLTACFELTCLTATGGSVWVDDNVEQVIVGALDSYTIARLQMVLPHVCTCKTTLENLQEQSRHKVQMADNNIYTDAFYA